MEQTIAQHYFENTRNLSQWKIYISKVSAFLETHYGDFFEDHWLDKAGSLFRLKQF